MPGSSNRIAALLEFLKEDPSDPSTRYMLALEYISSGEPEKAMSEMHCIYDQAPGYLPNYYHYGKLLEAAGETERAVFIYEAGIKLAMANRDMHTLNELRSALDGIQ
jgi:tetratricopeptide (TPR) repeat protein